MSAKEPWGEGTPWKNSSAFFTYIRGCLRRCWNKSPTKIAVLNKLRYQIPNPNLRGNKSTVWGADCAMCHKAFVIKDIQVDHITPAGSLQKTEDIQGFVERLLYVTEDDLRLVCKECNSALALSDKQGISFQEASYHKQAIALQKTKKDSEWLKCRGILPGSNKDKRRVQIVDKLREEDNAND